MADKDFVRAKVVDIRRPGRQPPSQAAVDASVLYFLYYPNFTALSAAGGRLPLPYQLQDYARWFAAALRGGTSFYAHPMTCGEFARAAEYAELEAFWVSSPTRPSGQAFSPNVCKQVRYAQPPAFLAGVRRRAEGYVRSMRKVVGLLPLRPAAEDERDEQMKEWLSSAGDFGDAALVAGAKYARVPHVLADDIDLLTFDAITVYTANQRAIAAARAAGALL